jgi:hypothetical protein
MRGVGRIFEDFAAGSLEDDDEVALLMGPPEMGYRALSEPLVNIRATLEAAERSAIIDRATRSFLVRLAKATHYKLRSHARLIDEARAQGADGETLEALADWLPTGRIDQKRADALEMLEVMRADLERDSCSTHASSFVFEHTRLWDNMARATCISLTSGGVEASLLSGIIEELQLEDGAFANAVAGGLLRYLELAEARRRCPITEADLVRAERALRGRYRLSSDESLQAWCAANSLNEEGFSQLVREEALLGVLRSRYGPDAISGMPNYLRTTDGFAPMAARAREKRRLLSEHGLENPTLENFGLSLRDLVEWYVRRGGALADDGKTLAGYVGDDPTAFTTALLREYAYATLAGKTKDT